MTEPAIARRPFRFAKGESKDKIARGYLAGHNGGEQILFAGVAQEKTRVWRTRQRRDPVTGKRYPWLCQEQAMVNHWYFYGFDAGFGPFYVKFCGYFPYTGQIYLNGHEYAKRQCLKAGIGFTALDNAFGATDDPAAVQRDRLARDDAAEARRYAQPIASREMILQVLAASDGPMDADALAEKLGLTESDRFDALSKRLGAMVREGQLLQNRRGGFAPSLPSNEAAVEVILRAIEGAGYRPGGCS